VGRAITDELVRGLRDNIMMAIPEKVGKSEAI